MDTVFGVPSTVEEEEKEFDDEVPLQTARTKDIEGVLEDLKSSRCCYVIVRHTSDRELALKRFKENPLKSLDGNQDLFTRPAHCEPDTVKWQGFDERPLKFYSDCVIGCFVVFIAVIILDVFFYAPYVTYIISYSDIPGMSQGGFISGTLLGLLISVCNAIIYAIIGFVTDYVSWTNGDCKDCFYCIKYTLAVFFNTCLDLGTVLILAQGFSVDEAMKIQAANEITDDSTMSAKAMAESPNMQKALYVQLVAYIFPSCLLLPFCMEPLANIALHSLNARLVKSRGEVTKHVAERLLQAPLFDLSRYGDILVNMMLVCLTMVFTYSTLWLLYVYFVISSVVIYMWDQCRVLRCSTRTIFAGNTMDNHMAYMMALPCGVLACCLVFKAYGMSHHGFLDDLRKQIKGDVGLHPDRHNVWILMALAFFGHMALHWFLVRFVAVPIADRDLPEEGVDHWKEFKDWPKGAQVKMEAIKDWPGTTPPLPATTVCSEQKDIMADNGMDVDDIEACIKKDPPFEVMAAEMPASWFNTNPVHCLRSKYKFRHTASATRRLSSYRSEGKPDDEQVAGHIVPYRIGKEKHLLINQGQGCYFDGPCNETSKFPEGMNVTVCSEVDIEGGFDRVGPDSDSEAREGTVVGYPQAKDGTYRIKVEFPDGTQQEVMPRQLKKALDQLHHASSPTEHDSTKEFFKKTFKSARNNFNDWADGVASDSDHEHPAESPDTSGAKNSSG
jgi:hypothetical protein